MADFRIQVPDTVMVATNIHFFFTEMEMSPFDEIKYSSLAALEVVKMTASDENVVKMMTF